MDRLGPDMKGRFGSEESASFRTFVVVCPSTLLLEELNLVEEHIDRIEVMDAWLLQFLLFSSLLFSSLLFSSLLCTPFGKRTGRKTLDTLYSTTNNHASHPPYFPSPSLSTYPSTIVSTYLPSYPLPPQSSPSHLHLKKEFNIAKTRTTSTLTPFFPTPNPLSPSLPPTN